MKIIKCDVCGKVINHNNYPIKIENLFFIEDCCKDCAEKTKEYLKSQQNHFQL